MKAERDKTELPPFQPAKPKVVDGLRTLFALPNSTFADEKFKGSLNLKKSFVDCCIAPAQVTETDFEFKEYKCHKHGSLNPKSLFSGLPADTELGSLGSVVEAIDGTLVETSQDAQEAAIVNDSDGGSEDDQARAIPTTVTW